MNSDKSHNHKCNVHGRRITLEDHSTKRHLEEKVSAQLPYHQGVTGPIAGADPGFPVLEAGMKAPPGSVNASFLTYFPSRKLTSILNSFHQPELDTKKMYLKILIDLLRPIHTYRFCLCLR